MSDRTDLSPVLDAMDATWASIVELAGSLTAADWSAPTRCPGWDVHDQIAHIASLEQLLAGAELPPEAPPAAHIRNPVGARMERGVHALRGLPPGELVDVLRAAIATRRAALQANPPKSGDELVGVMGNPVGARMERGVHALRGLPRAELVDVLRAAIATRRAALQANPPKSGDELVGVMGNPVPAERSLPIRVFDLWVHEQDVRVATGRPGNADGPGAQVGRDLIVGMLPMHWAKAAGAQPGQTLRLRVSGALPFERLVVVGDDGRAALVDPAAADPTADPAIDPAVDPATDPVTTVELDWLDLVARANGRTGADQTPVTITGDSAMGQAVVDALPMSP